ncbi:MAG TPA: DUF4256 domain-containing protein [Draconibacterium sp.]|nr:DUF4256 domain-containing protein [Draconibacterium sp.]
MSRTTNKQILSREQSAELLQILQTRFEKNMHRHTGLDWIKIKPRIKHNSYKMWALNKMEETGGEPDIVEYDTDKNEYHFYDCSKQSPAGRRSVCYDLEALESRKKFKPRHSAIGMAAEIGIEILTEKQYRKLQLLENFDTKTSSWIYTPAPIRQLGGALFGDFRYETTFIYHNGAESYYSARGFRGCLRV